MLVEGRIKQPPSTRFVDSSGAASVSRSDPVPAPILSECSRPSARQRRSPIQSHRSFTTESHWRKRLPLNRVRHWHRALICKLLTILAYITSSNTRAVSSASPSSSLRPSASRSPRLTSSHRSVASSRSPSRFATLLLICTFAMTCAIGVHCSTPTSNSHSASHTSQHSTNHLNSNQKLLKQLVERQFFSRMGFSSEPRPPPHHKVPEYMLDLYHWFRTRTRERYEEVDEHSPYSSPNAVIALETNDLRSLSTPPRHQYDLSYEDDEEAKEDARILKLVESHHRAPTKRRQSQMSRVTLKGTANTVIGHKLKNHDHAQTNRRVKRSTAAESEEPSPSSEVHLQFDFPTHLPEGEFLKGCELRIYQHSIYDVGHPVEPANVSSVAGTSSPAGPNHLYHWSVRYRSEHRQSLPAPTPKPSSSASPTAASPSSISTATPNSHPSAQNLSSGEEYPGSRHDEEYYMQRIKVYHLLRPVDELHSVTIRSPAGQNRQMSPVTKLIDTQVVDVRKSGWLSFDIFSASDNWLKHPKENFGLLVTFTDLKGRPTSRHSSLVVVNPEDSHVQSTSQSSEDSQHPWHEVQPLVVTFSGKDEHVEQSPERRRVKREHTHKHKRRLRTRKPNKSHSKREKCSRQPMFFDFQAVGWMDWILAPPGFQAYYCHGECKYPMGEHLNYTNHATIQALVNSVNQATVPTPCCVPTELSPITLLYYDVNNKVVLTNYHDMVVEGCGCR